ncbi:hypothetical protein Q2K19_05115 [Micromonospora soli]|uniref:hypothetical protein n=1 Tax=Micromonospora sp. NBRC 110009 TaxID=3061627 RepID=UPI002672B32E|nr:hypothetical protein [Micromonospora sp. NBRC 110009]WKT99873.1 hypothetical protein Q2K19_05115 [Micromonospora sp. NBRC 110009]
MRWLVVLVIIVLAVLAARRWARTRRAPIDGERQVRDLRASGEARRRLGDQRGREDRGGVGGWSL